MGVSFIRSMPYNKTDDEGNTVFTNKDSLKSASDSYDFFQQSDLFLRIYSNIEWDCGSRISNKQAETGPSRRHIQHSKIAKRLPSVKYSQLQYSKIKNFSKKNFEKITYSKNEKKIDRVAR